MNIFDGSVSGGTLCLLVLCLTIALGFEFVNGFHDTANAVATVIYTKSLKPGVAVVWSGFCNFLGVYIGTVFGSAAVAFGIVHLLPMDLLLHIGEAAGLYMILSLLVAAVVWNLITWFFGIPNSSSHALVGAILGVGLVASLFRGQGFGAGVNWAQAQKAALSLLVSPLVGFCGAALLLLASKALIKAPALYQEPKGDAPPPPAIRALLFVTCSLVSYFHGSNDGQKGVGLIMLILIAILPTQFALNDGLNPEKLQKTATAVRQIEAIVAKAPAGPSDEALTAKLKSIDQTVGGAGNLGHLGAEQRNALRTNVLTVGKDLDGFEKEASLSSNDKKALKSARVSLSELTDFVTPWVPVAVAIALGVGTTVGWKRIVVTVGEKIGKTHLSYAQGATAELMAAFTIFLGDRLGLPVSTTHVLSSGVAGTMAANHSGLQGNTVRNIALAWVTTIPATAILAGSLFAATAGNALQHKTVVAKQSAPVATAVQVTQLEAQLRSAR